MKTFLLLWDIDGTLISSGGAGMRAMRTALRSGFGIDGTTEDIDYAGRTDRWIMRQIFSKYGLSATEDNFARYSEAYLAYLVPEMTASKARVLPGVRGLLEAAAAHDGAAQGLLTGNMQRGARMKLGFVQLWDFFPFGAFADDSELRNDLGPHALERARKRHGVDFPPHRTWIIGDTPHDIACARVIGANSLAVATGSHTVADLEAHGPTAVLPDLANSSEFWKIVERSPA